MFSELLRLFKEKPLPDLMSRGRGIREPGLCGTEGIDYRDSSNSWPWIKEEKPSTAKNPDYVRVDGITEPLMTLGDNIKLAKILRDGEVE